MRLLTYPARAERHSVQRFVGLALIWAWLIAGSCRMAVINQDEDRAASKCCPVIPKFLDARHAQSKQPVLSSLDQSIHKDRELDSLYVSTLDQNLALQLETCTGGAGGKRNGLECRCVHETKPAC